MIKFRFKIKFYVEKKYSSILIFIALELIWFSIFCFILGKTLYFTHETARFLDLISQYNNFIHNNWIKSCPKQQQKKEVFSFWSLHPGDAWPTIIRPCRITQTAQSNWKYLSVAIRSSFISDINKTMEEESDQIEKTSFPK